ncbi:MAG: hypothetical protein AB1646_12920 [Thermodesulfobacteriota bacterium]
MKKNKRKLPAERNFLVPMMRLNCKSATHPDKKKEAARKACRIKLRPGWFWPPGSLFSDPPTAHPALHV